VPRQADEPTAEPARRGCACDFGSGPLHAPLNRRSQDERCFGSVPGSLGSGGPCRLPDLATCPARRFADPTGAPVPRHDGARRCGFSGGARSRVTDRRGCRDPSLDQHAPAGRGTGNRRCPSRSRTPPRRDRPTSVSAALPVSLSASTGKIASAIGSRSKTPRRRTIRSGEAVSTRGPGVTRPGPSTGLEIDFVNIPATFVTKLAVFEPGDRNGSLDGTFCASAR